MSQDLEERRKKWPGGPQNFNVGTKEVDSEKVWQNPSDYDSEYPYNHVFTTPAGHSVEYDDTDGKERIRIIHKDGSFVEMQHDGTRVVRSEGSSQQVVVKDNNVRVKGAEHVYIDGDANWKVGGDVNWEIGGDFKITVKGNVIYDTPLFHIKGNAVSHNDKDIGDTHRHTDVMPGGGLTGTPTPGEDV